MERDDWNLVTEMLDKGELSAEDRYKQHDTVGKYGGEYWWSAFYIVLTIILFATATLVDIMGI